MSASVGLILKDATAHLVGYVGAVGQSEISEDKMMALPGLRIGKTGIEKKYDEELRGQAGSSRIEVNVIGREVRELSRESPKDGRRMVLSIDAGLQQSVQERLNQHRSASAVIMDVHSGAIYALASSPSLIRICSPNPCQPISGKGFCLILVIR